MNRSVFFVVLFLLYFFFLPILICVVCHGDHVRLKIIIIRNTFLHIIFKGPALPSNVTLMLRICKV